MKKNIVYADLHTHSTASDGTMTPTELIKKAKEIGLAVIGITDHDTISGLEEAYKIGNKENVIVVPGIEISCGWEDRSTSVHVLGLFIDSKCKSLVDMLEEQRVSRFHRAFKILDLLEKEGIDVEELREEFKATPEKVLGRPHIARYLVRKGVVSEMQQAFEKYLLNGRPAYVPKQKVDPEYGIKLIHEAGGLAVLAHPGLISEFDEVWKRLEKLDWDGLEVYYSEHSNSTVKKFQTLADSKNLLATGGSDYHGENGKHVGRLGTAGLSKEQFEKIVEKVAKKEIVD